MIQGASPTQAESGQAGAFLGARQPVPPSTPSSGSQGRQMPQDSPGLGAKGGNVSGLGKGCGGYGSFPMQFQQGLRLELMVWHLMFVVFSRIFQ